jgi:HSP20 family molecular chaperone IbpA
MENINASSDMAPPSSVPAAMAEPAASERFSVYRRLLASPVDEPVHWWYFGTVLVVMDNMPALPAINAATLMVYRTETLSKERFAIHWDEVGYFADYVTGRPLESWLNPVTGERVAAPQTFAEGPARYDVSQTRDGVAVSLTQPGATIDSIEVNWTADRDRVSIVQRERKTRGFPEADGRLPHPDSASGFEAVTQLAFMDRWSADGRHTEGIYEFALAGAPPWMGFDARLNARATVHGVIKKAPVGVPPRPESDVILRERFPAFFAAHGA